jgi:hypothetical protein
MKHGIYVADSCSNFQEIHRFLWSPDAHFSAFTTNGH